MNELPKFCRESKCLKIRNNWRICGVTRIQINFIGDMKLRFPFVFNNETERDVDNRKWK